MSVIRDEADLEPPAVTSGFDTFRTWRDVRLESSAFRGRAEIGFWSRQDRF